jgi:sporulation protein YlmC with PRC-barrel domain
MKITHLLLAVAMALPLEAVAEQPDRSRLIGSPIYSSDGAEVGTIADVRLDESGGLSAVRVDAGARLGFGTKQVEIPGRAVTIVRGAAVLALPKEAVEMLPSIDKLAPSADQHQGF